ncbi:tyrosine-type recombinase/integrase [Bremerella alba]|uniref:Integrase n=1 Tax=Bremerella alba TaxID=980252 RepID=A0A7V8VA69_9BACT|nr:tyrosine-type recombinase/integrase [Bremerella alba]MBA2117809.1 hypothetical protein [Bremerella alba]
MGTAVEPDTAAWVAELKKDLADKLVRAGLIAPKVDAGAITLEQHLTEYVNRRTDVKPATRVNWGHTQRTLLDFFEKDKLLRSITPGEARDWQRWLQTGEARENAHADRGIDDGLAPNTIRKRVSNARQFLEDALSRELIAKNPFASLRGSVGANHARDFFVTREMAGRVLEACPDAQWRLLFALSRYGGLRCPSEHLALRWIDIDWERSRMRVRSPKTAHHEGKDHRIIPTFPELRPYLDTVWDEPSDDREFVITRYRQPNINLRTQLERIIERAGLSGWPKIFQNLRASRATELAAEHPEHVAAAWAGHSTIIAKKHYWRVTDSDFEKALSGGLAQNAAQHAAGDECTRSRGA